MASVAEWMPIATLLAKRRALATALKPYAGRVVDRYLIANFASLVVSHLKQSQVSAAEDTLRPYLGQELLQGTLDCIANRLVGNVDLLKSGQPVVMTPALSDKPTPGLFYISRIDNYPPSKTRRYSFLLECFTGELSGYALPWVVTQPLTSILAKRLGFSTLRGKYRFEHVQQLSGLFFMATVSAKGRDAAISSVADLQQIKDYNRKTVLKVRCRVDVDCPVGVEQPCHRCARGRDRCPHATHALTFKKTVCSVCRMVDVPYNPEFSADMCVACMAAKQSKPAT